MTAKILQLANSISFGLGQHISNPTQACDLLGLDTIKILTLSVHTFSQFEQDQLDGLSLTALWDHSVAVGGVARRIALVEGAERKSADSTFMAGLLHDIGMLVLAVNLPEEHGSALALASKIGYLEAERETFGSTHAEVGAYLLGLWGLPCPIVAATAFHHNLMKCLDNTFDTLTAVHVANALAREMYPTRREAVATIDHAYLAKLGLTERLSVWREICRETNQEGEDR